MNALSRLCRWWLGIAADRRWLEVDGAQQPLPVTQADLNSAYQLGFMNGKATGELGGRNGVILEMEMVLAARGKVLNEAEPEDVQAAKRRTVH